MEIERSAITGFTRFLPDTFVDKRGSFTEWVNPFLLQDSSIPFVMAQGNIVKSKKNVIRGLHFSIAPQIKVITCAVGEIRDVVVDIRPNSKTFGEYAIFSLDSLTRATVTIQPGLAHGYEVLSDIAEVVYLTNTTYNPADDYAISPTLEMSAAMWVTRSPILSERDSKAPSFTSIVDSNLLNLLNS